MESTGKRYLVCGGRDFGLNKDEYRFIFDTLYRFIPADEYLPLPGTVIITGAAPGVDTAAGDWAVVNWTELMEYPADWDHYGKAAGFIRNQRMLDEGNPDCVIAFPGGNGTANMVSLARKAGVEVIEVKYDRTN